MLRILKGTEELADGTPQGSVVEIKDAISGERAVQEETLLRAGQPTFFDRLTVRNVLNITIHRQVAGLPRALHLALTRRQTLTGTGKLVIELTADGVTHRWTAARAAWKQTEPKPLGASVQIGYQVTCGTFVYTSSNDEDWVADQVDGGTLPDEQDEPDLDGGAALDNRAFADCDGGTLT